MIYGYARVSSTGQDLAQQLAQLDAVGCTKIYREKVSAATAERSQLKRAIGALDAGDVLIVTSTDRLARNTRDLLNILHTVKEAGAGFRSIAEPMVDTTSQFADVIIAVLGVAASYEQHRITERTAAGRVQAKARVSSSADVLPLPLTSRPRRYNALQLEIPNALSRHCLGWIKQRYHDCIDEGAKPRGAFVNRIRPGWVVTGVRR